MIKAIGRYVTWVLRLIGFAAFFAWELSVASADVAWDVISPRSRFAPGIVKFPLRCRTEFEITMMSNVITLTPGTLTLAVELEPPTLYVHAMYARDRERARASLRRFEGRMLHALRPDGRVDDGGETAEWDGSGVRQ